MLVSVLEIRGELLLLFRVRLGWLLFPLLTRCVMRLRMLLVPIVLSVVLDILVTSEIPFLVLAVSMMMVLLSCRPVRLMVLCRFPVLILLRCFAMIWTLLIAVVLVSSLLSVLSVVPVPNDLSLCLSPPR